MPHSPNVVVLFVTTNVTFSSMIKSFWNVTVPAVLTTVPGPPVDLMWLKIIQLLPPMRVSVCPARSSG